MTVDDVANQVLNLSEKEAMDIISNAGFTSRLVERDGVRFMGVRNFRANRINLTVANGVVIKTTVG
jgi:hypothetical protein